MKAAFFIPCRNKEQWVGRAIRSVLAQTRPIDIIISDQGSTDRTRDVALSVVEGYTGPHKIILTECPDRTPFGLAGLNAHIRWVNETFTDYDAFLAVAADDTVEPDCAKDCLEAMERTGADGIGSLRHFVDPNNNGVVQVTPFPKESRFVTAKEHFEQRVGGSTFWGWRRDLCTWAPPMSDTQPDVWMPYWAICRNGFYVIADKVLGTYFQHSDPNNAGAEGVRKAAKTHIEVERVNERIWLELVRTTSRAVSLAIEKEEMGGWKWPEEPKRAAIETLVGVATGYAGCHDNLLAMEAAGEEAVAASFKSIPAAEGHDKHALARIEEMVQGEVLKATDEAAVRAGLR